jgi:hypothetical protein
MIEARMQFDISGGTKLQRAVIEEIIEWTIPKVITQNLIDKLFLTLNITKRITKDDVPGLTMEDLAGICLWVDRGVKPREFEIFISNNQEEKIFHSTVMHELTHLSQYMTGRLKHKITDNNFYWEDRLYDIDNSEYYEWPWENEALYNEVLLMNKWHKEKTGRKCYLSKEFNLLAA